ncbi:metallophosphoesterase [Paenibacillus sp. RC67]|uniref:metallophosphoesterase family protein n=1 Tax=Paenibacillus sp. RC67 TaxID=3039392 RepID=UPI0024ACB20E|nr:metallophosphoesterase [Paenibacillus sp. RC67]
MRFIIMGDFHYSLMGDSAAELLQARDSFYEEMLEHFIRMDAEFHISIGDLTHEGLPEEFDYVFNRIGNSECNFIQVLGNHDAYTLPKAEIMGLTRQQRYHTIDSDEAMLIFLDTTKEMNRIDWGGELDVEQLEWLKVQLDKSGHKPVFIFAHHPVYGTTAHSTLEKMSIDPTIDMLEVLKRKQGPGFYFCGHNHMNSIVQKENWHFIQTAACLDVPAFRRVELTDRGVQIDLVDVNNTELAEHITIFNTGIPGFTPVSEACGEEADQRLQVIF